ncbi:hypothetical protein PsYK624_133610 [Phanerochaete sordida]|uniref:Uncharacterized protein n=1 Tax=Phanerochaete sordida TaxID=48140 RepID=A0A9P3LJY3_9APHY|nr:hypothetical protein PsYK624_133610 [Phanerochaete sordida]
MKFIVSLSMLLLAAGVLATPFDGNEIAKRDCNSECGTTFAACEANNGPNCSQNEQACVAACAHKSCPRDLEGRATC